MSSQPRRLVRTKRRSAKKMLHNTALQTGTVARHAGLFSTYRGIAPRTSPRYPDSSGAAVSAKSAKNTLALFRLVRGSPMPVLLAAL